MSISSLAVVILNKDQSSLILPKLSLLQKYADDIFILDDFSNEGTSVWKSAPKVQILQHALQNDFAAHRNFALTKVKSDWTLFLDADETASEELMEEICSAIQSDTADALILSRQDIFLGKPLLGGEAARINLLRCAKTSLGQKRWRRAVHEVWDIPHAQKLTLSHKLLHEPHQSITAFLSKLHFYAANEPLARSKPGRIQWFFELCTYPFAKFLWNFFFLQGFRDGKIGVIHALCMAYYSLITRIFLYEKYFLKEQHHD